ncbi:MAG: YdbH domain-containing protein [Desulfobacterales bacterium]
MRFVYNKIAILLLVIAVAACGFFAVLRYVSPFILEERLLPDLVQAAGIERFSCNVRHIGLFGADLTDIRMGTASDAGIVIDSVDIDYSPLGVLGKRVKTIRIHGITVVTELTDKAFSIPGVWPLDAEVTGSHRENETPDQGMDFYVHQIRVTNGRIIRVEADRSYRIPFSLNIDARSPDMTRLSCKGWAYPFGQAVGLSADADLENGSTAIHLASQAFALGSLAPIAGLPPDAALLGAADVSVSTRIRFSPFAIAMFSAHAEIHNPDIRYGDFRTRVSESAEKPSVPVRLSFEKKSDNAWQLEISDLRIASPVPVQLSRITSTLSIENAGITGEGDILASFDQPGRPPSPEARSPAELAGRFSFAVPNEGGWSLELGNESLPQALISASTGDIWIGDLHIRPVVPRFTIAANGSENGVTADFSLGLDHIEASGPVSVNVESLNIKGSLSIGSPDTPTIRLALTSGKSRLEFEAAEITLPELSIEGHCENPTAPNRHCSGTITVLDAQAHIRDSGIGFTGISVVLPLAWPLTDPAPSGNFTINRIRSGETELGNASGTMRQIGPGVSFKGSHVNPLLPKFTVDFSGKTEFADTSDMLTVSLTCHSRPYVTSAPLDLERLIPTAKGFTFSGSFSVSGMVSYTPQGVHAALNAGVQNGALENPEAGLTIRGIHTRLAVPDLTAFRSAPKQRLEFASAAFGDFFVDGGVIQFQIESGDSLLIEKAGFNWCNGHVNTYALRIAGDQRDYDAILYCDRLDLAMLLDQFGAADAEGKGAVNGRIPLQYINGRLVVQDGFLYSTPGQGGIIHVRNTEKLLAGIPPGSPEHAQMDLAREVLKSYDYNWATLGLTTEESDLIMRLNLNGKPTDPLPFIYEPSVGRFVKVEPDEQGSEFQGVNLTINFRLPLNALLRYRDILKMLN